MQRPNNDLPIRGICTTVDGANVYKPVFIIDSRKNGSSWYRKYSDGRIEQGGYYSMPEHSGNTIDGEYQFDFGQAFTDATSVSIFLTCKSAGVKFTNTSSGIAISSNTASTFVVHFDAYFASIPGFYWKATGK